MKDPSFSIEGGGYREIQAEKNVLSQISNFTRGKRNRTFVSVSFKVQNKSCPRPEL